MIAGNYEVLPITVRSIINPAVAEQSKSGRRKASTEGKPSFVVMYHYLYMRHLRTGYTFAFVGSKRKGETRFSDGRHDVAEQGAKPYRMNNVEFLNAIEELVPGHGVKLLTTMYSNVVKGKDAAEMVEPFKATIANATTALKAQNVLFKAIANK